MTFSERYGYLLIIIGGFTMSGVAAYGCYSWCQKGFFPQAIMLGVLSFALTFFPVLLIGLWIKNEK